MQVTFPPSANARGGAEVDVVLDVLHGSVPNALWGSVFGVAPHGPIGSGTPFLNGPPLFYRLDFSGGVAKMRTRRGGGLFARVEAGAAAEHEEWAFKDFGITRLSPKLGARDFSNTALVPIRLPGGETGLLATYDAGRPYHLDPETLRLLSPVGEQPWWRANLLMDRPFKQVFSTAHPAYDERTGELFVVNHGKSLEEVARRLFKFLGRWLPWTPFTDRTLGRGVDDALRNLVTVLRGAQVSSKLLLGRASDDKTLALSPVKRRNAIGRLRDELALLEWAMGFAKMLSEFAQDGPQPGESPATPFTYLLRWNPDGTRRRYELRHKGEALQVFESAHQMAVTRDHVVFVDAAFKMELDGITTLPDNIPEALVSLFREEVSRPQSSTARFYFVKRSDLDRTDLPGNGHPSFPAMVVEAAVVEVPGEVVHFHADYEPPAPGRAMIHAIHQCAMDGAEFVLRGDVRWDGREIPSTVFGTFPAAMSVNAVGSHEIDVAGERVVVGRTLTAPDLGWALGLSAGPGITTWGAPQDRLTDLYLYSPGLVPDTLTKLVHTLYQSYPNRAAQDLARILAQGGAPSTLVRVDLGRFTLADHYALAADQQFVSPQYVPDAGGGDGWIVCNVFSGPASIDRGFHPREVWVFAAKGLASGPLCRLGHRDLDFGYTLHTAWLPGYVSTDGKVPVVTPAQDLAPWMHHPEVRDFHDRYLK